MTASRTPVETSPWRSRGRAAFVVVFAASLVAGCKKGPPPAPSEPVFGEQAVGAPPLVVPAAPLSPARCTLGEPSAEVGEGLLHPLETGEAIATPDGFAFGFLAPVRGGTRAGIARVTADLLHVKLAVLDPSVIAADGEPPRPVPDGLGIDALFATTDVDRAAPMPGAGARGVKGGGTDAGPTHLARPSLALVRFPAGGGVSRAGAWDLGDEVAPDADGLVGARAQVVAYTADAPSTHRGNVTLASLRGGEPRIVSPAEVSADTPRLARRGDGAWLVWVAHRPERGSDLAPNAAGEAIEAPGQVREYAWGQVVALDADGAPVGNARDLTSPHGHVGDLELAPLASGALDVFLREDDETHEGDGGKILRVRVGADPTSLPSAPSLVVDGGVGRGSLALLLAPSGDGWLAYDDTGDRSRLVPLDTERAPLGPPSVEPAFEGGRPLFATSSAALVAVFPDEDRPLRAVTCRRSGAP